MKPTASRRELKRMKTMKLSSSNRRITITAMTKCKVNNELKMSLSLNESIDNSTLKRFNHLTC